MSRSADRSRASSSTRPPADPWRNRVVGHAEVAPDTLLAHPENWRRHPAHQRRALRATLHHIGWVQGAIVNRQTGRILDGHARVEEAVARGEPTVPVTFVELETDEERQVLATFDTIGGLALADPAALEALIASLAPMAGDLQVMLDGLAELLPRINRPKGDPEAVPPVPDAASTYVRPGQLWRLDPSDPVR